MLVILFGLGKAPVRAQVAPDFGFGMNFNHTDFMLGFNGGAAFEALDLSARLGFQFRVGSKRVLVETEVPDVLVQYRERRYLLGIELEKRFTLTEFSSNERLGVWLAPWGGLSIGDYRGSKASSPGGLAWSMQGGIFFNTDGVVLRGGYAWLPLQTNSIVNHRIVFGVNFHIL